MAIPTQRPSIALFATIVCVTAACDSTPATEKASTSIASAAKPSAAAPSSSAPAAAEAPAGQPLTDVVDLAVGEQMSCALKKDQSVWCWAVGELAKRTIMVDAARVGVVRGFLCAIQKGGQIACSKPYAGEIIPVPLYRDGVNIVGGPEGYCVDTEDGVLRCGVEDVEAEKVKPPSGLPGLKHPSAFSVGLHYGFGLIESDVWCWDNRKGPGLPKTMAPVEGAKGVAVGRQRACAFTEAGEVWCYDLTAGDKPFDAKPAKLDGWAGVKWLTMSYGKEARDGLCALGADGSVACSELSGDGADARFGAPKPVAGATDVEQLATGAATHSCVRTKKGTVSCWKRGAEAEPVRQAPAKGKP
ncbi:MAG: hypothetical protein JRI23_32000 [Deltaproteobacteria bacterium]|jgi:hypothetical protein|nr:hypothetical protein [Deltaproteobacteria bacterium]MBW2536851.1 hypothetical protein [Deltaproteobacteria bacterium]